MRSAPPPPLTFPKSIGQYRIVERIAVGGMAEVFRAETTNGDSVVLKRMLPHIAADPSGPAMFHEEARLGARVRHSHVVKFIESGEDGGQPFLALEYVPGCDLWKLSRFCVREKKPLGLELTLFVLRELLLGLHSVHDATDIDGNALGIIHQDVSPSNVLLSIHGEVKVGDLGIARAAAKVRQALSFRPKGKLGYLAPEQVTGAGSTAATDVFAAAVIGAELLLGAPLFAGASELSILLAIRDASLEPLQRLDLQPSIRAVLYRALAKQPSDRYATALEFANAVSGVLRADPLLLRSELAERVRAASGMEVTREGPTFERPVTPVTASLPDHRFDVSLASGGKLSGMTFAQIVEAVTVGKVGAQDFVSVDGATPVPLPASPLLSRHLPLAALTPVTRDVVVAQAPDRNKDLRLNGFAGALADSALRGATGLWLCESGGRRKEIYVQDGKPTFVNSNIGTDLLGEHLVSRNVISRGELEMALAILPRFDGRLGDTLVALGLIDPVVLFQAIAEQLRDKLLELFTWRDGTAEFYEGVPSPSHRFPLDTDVWAICDLGLTRRIGLGLDDDVLRDGNQTVLAATPNPYKELQLPPVLARLLTIVRGGTSVTDVMRRLATNADPDSGAKALLLGLATGVVCVSGAME